MWWWLSVSVGVVYLGFYLTIVFLTLGIACALFYLAELIEEYTNTTRRLIGYAIRAEWVLHILLLTDRHPVTHVALGLVAHALYQRLLRRFPYTSLTAPETLASVGAFVLSTYLWATRVRGLHHSMEYTISFLLVTTWLVPLTILMGVAGDTAVLPTSGSSASFGGPYYGAGPSVQTSSAAKAKSKSRSVALRVFDLLRRKRDDLMPTVAGQLPGAFPKQKD